MQDSRGETVGPVVHKDGVVAGICEWDGVSVPEERWASGGQRSPVQTFLDDEVGYAAVALSDVVGPGEVAAEIGWEAFEIF